MRQPSLRLGIRNSATSMCVMVKDLTEYQAEAIACGYTHDFGLDGKSALSDTVRQLSCRPAQVSLY